MYLAGRHQVHKSTYFLHLQIWTGLSNIRIGMNLFLNAEEAEASSPFIRGLRIIRQTSFRLHRTFERDNSERDGALSPVADTPDTTAITGQLIERVTHFAGHKQKPYTKERASFFIVLWRKMGFEYRTPFL